MKRLLRLLLLSTTAAAMPMMAETAGKGVVVISKDGSRHEVALSDVRRIDIGQTGVTVNHRDGESHERKFEEIDRILIGSAVAGIEDVVKDGDVAVWPTVTDGPVNIAGLADGTQIEFKNRVLGLAGNIIAEHVSQGDVAKIDLAAAVSGVYVVSFGKESVKVIKK